MNHKKSYKYDTVKKALTRVEEQKINYEKNLLDKTFAYAFIVNNIISFKEVIFRKENYLHLTGLDYQKRLYKKRHGNPNISTKALEFYNRLGEAELIKDVSFLYGDSNEETKLNFVHTQHKLENLSKLTNIAFKAEYIGKYHGTQTFDIIINRSQNSIAFINNNDGGFYIPTSSLYGDINKTATDIKPILAIFEANYQLSQFKYVLKYLNKEIKIGNAKFDKNIIEKFDDNSFKNDEVKFNRDQLEQFVESYRKTITMLKNNESNY